MVLLHLHNDIITIFLIQIGSSTRETNLLGHTATPYFASVPWLRHKLNQLTYGLSTCSAIRHQVATKQTDQPLTAASYHGSGPNYHDYCHNIIH